VRDAAIVQNKARNVQVETWKIRGICSPLVHAEVSVGIATVNLPLRSTEAAYLGVTKLCVLRHFVHS
jgi:hypothetical protein